ncbi:MAG: Kae1-associated kinase Bud32 [Nitrososphaerota archaeon]|nr:Kae1-associated kinase Bud32 [Nitrososphaerota archaeon]MDG7022165.1 Kae1-associated kinase Bud32 [Nitrososphaerota archaeon]
MELIYRGAEADVFKGGWCDRPAVYKVRKPLTYRLPELDGLIRSQRTSHEAQIIHQSRGAGVPAPWLYYVSPEEALLVMEFVEGERLKTVLLDPAMTGRRARELGAEFGRDIARLHAAGIMHGDLTTSNVIVGGGRLTLIDFGLAIRSQRLEDQAVDLRLIKETVTGAHNGVSKPFMRSLLAGYSEVLGGTRTAAAARKLAEIERRGRYARVE